MIRQLSSSVSPHPPLPDHPHVPRYEPTSASHPSFSVPSMATSMSSIQIPTISLPAGSPFPQDASPTCRVTLEVVSSPLVSKTRPDSQSSVSGTCASQMESNPKPTFLGHPSSYPKARSSMAAGPTQSPPSPTLPPCPSSQSPWPMAQSCSSGALTQHSCRHLPRLQPINPPHPKRPCPL